MALALALTGYPSTVATPGNVVQVSFAVGQVAGNSGPKKMLILGPSTSAGSITQDTEIAGPISDEAEIIALAGPGSIGHRMVRAAMGTNPNVQYYYGAPTRSAGTAASLVITFGAAPTTIGTATLKFDGETVAFSYDSSDTVTTIATGLATAINTKTHWPFTGANALGVLTLTAKNAGPTGNTIRVSPTISSGTGLTSTVTTATSLASGATYEDYTTILTTIAPSAYDLIVVHSDDSAASGALEDERDQIQTQALPANGIRQQAVAATSTDAASAVAIAQGLNEPRMMLVNQEQSPQENYVTAAKVAAARSLEEWSYAGYNYDGYGTRPGNIFRVKAPYNASEIPTATETELMLSGGVTPISVTKSGQPYIVRAITTYCLNGATPDYRARDVNVVTSADEIASQVIGRFANAGWQKLTADPPEGKKQPGTLFCTPNRAKALAETVIRDGATGDLPILDPGSLTDMLTGLAVGIDPGNSSRLNVSMPIEAAVNLHTTATKVSEVSEAVLWR